MSQQTTTELVRKLKRYKELHFLTQEQLEEELGGGVDQTSLSRWFKQLAEVDAGKRTHVPMAVRKQLAVQAFLKKQGTRNR